MTTSGKGMAGMTGMMQGMMPGMMQGKGGATMVGGALAVHGALINDPSLLKCALGWGADHLNTLKHI